MDTITAAVDTTIAKKATLLIWRCSGLSPAAKPPALIALIDNL